MARAGTFVQQGVGPERFSAFIPRPLPSDPPVELGPRLRQIYEEAVHAVGQLEGVLKTMDPDRLLYMYVRKEAVLSSQIEGTQSTLSDLLEFENAGVPGTPGWRGAGGFPLRGGALSRPGADPAWRAASQPASDPGDARSADAGGQGQRPEPGRVPAYTELDRRDRPGNARFVPPPPPEMRRALHDLEGFLHDERGRTAPILKAGLAHVQFETIHPFLDGNGRIGRLLISLLFVIDGLLTQPFFYFSLYLKENRADYYDALQKVRTHGDWEGWLHFYLVGVEAVARQAADTALSLRALFETDRQRIAGLGRAAGSAFRVYDLLRERVIVSIPRCAEELGLT